jgi:type IV pilus assembly protein PilV
MTARRFPRGTRRRARGFSLIEVLVTILIFAVGLLGMAALQAVSMRSNQSANFRTQATALAYMIIDRMHANADAIARGEYLADLVGGDCSAGPDDGDATAVYDLKEWRQQLACQLPDGQGAIWSQDDGVHVQITWTDARWSLVASERSTTFELVTKL